MTSYLSMAVSFCLLGGLALPATPSIATVIDISSAFNYDTIVDDKTEVVGGVSATGGYVPESPNRVNGFLVTERGSSLTVSCVLN